MGEFFEFDEKTLEKMSECTKNEFPICLQATMLAMFGPEGRKRLDSIVMNETFENSEIKLPEDIWSLYSKYMERVGNILGEDAEEVVRFEALKYMEANSCAMCPVHSFRIREKKNICGT